MIKLHLHVLVLLRNAFEEDPAAVEVASIGPLNDDTAVQDFVEVPLNFEHPPVFLYVKCRLAFSPPPLFALTKDEDDEESTLLRGSRSQ